MAKTATATTTYQKVVLKITEALYDKFSLRALNFGTSPEAQMTARLEACADHTASMGIYLNDGHRNTLSQLAGRAIQSPQDLINWAHSVSSIKVAGTEVELNNQLLIRLQSRAFGKPMPEHMRQIVTECLEQFCGMR